MEDRWQQIIQHQEKVIASQERLIQNLEKENERLRGMLGQQQVAVPPVTVAQPQSSIEKPVCQEKHSPRKSSPQRRVDFALHIPPPETRESDEQQEQPIPEQPKPKVVDVPIPIVQKITSVRSIPITRSPGGTWQDGEDGYTLYSDEKREQIAVISYASKDEEGSEAIFFFTHAKLAEYFAQQLNIAGLVVARAFRQDLEISRQHIPIMAVDIGDGGITYTVL